MLDALIPYYLWLKSFHVVSVIAWMAGLFYLPRLFVYHSQPQTTPETRTTFLIMQDKLYRFIMQPSMIFSLTTGVILANILDTWSTPWLHIKLLSILLLLVFHFSLRKWHFEFERGETKRTERFYRMINEVPTLLLIVIVVSVIVKPFS
jgi:putative membrane protein